MNRQTLPDSRTRRVAVALIIATASLLLNAQPVVHAAVFYAFPFDGIGPNGYSHGKILFSELIQGADGNFYGTTVAGGSGACADGFGVEGCGTIFRITPAGVQTVLYNFLYDSVTNTAVNGIYPYGGLVQGKDGNFYGTASAGGNPSAGGNGCNLGCGTIFKITPAGKFTLLHQFAGVGGKPPEGAGPTGRLIQASDGRFYGTTYSGGSVEGFNNQGTIFSITPSGVFSTLHQFDNVHAVRDGANPYAGLIRATDGNFYGTTYFGGTDGVGTVFRFSKSTGVVTVLHSFVQPLHGDFPDGAYPLAALVQASDGSLVGATTTGGAVQADDNGTLFRITTKGVFAKLWDFDAKTGGSYPQGGLIQASDGNFYGTTQVGGQADCSCGTVYRLTPSGTVTPLTAFEDATAGRWPLAVPLQGADGSLYITNSRGPSIGPHDGGGTVIRIDNGLPKPAPVITKFSPASGSVGKKVTISGDHFVGTIGVSFSGTMASFTVKSATTVVAVVPAGAMSGRITVTNAGGSAASAKSFTVLP
jgi:uncharacterized repeat protein (TIGR03803 family)